MVLSYGILHENKGGREDILNIFSKYGQFGCFWKVLFSPFFVTKNQICPTSSDNSENKGDWGVKPLKEEFHN